jgi:hypothetical protein
MAGPFFTPALAGSVLAAVVLGVHLGDSSIGLIHPVHFKGPSIHPRVRGAAIEEGAVTARGPVYADLYGWEEGNRLRAEDCGDCDALTARDAYAYSAEVPYFGGAADRAPREARAVPEPVPVRLTAPVEDYPAASDAVIVRYASYPVDAAEAEAPSEEAEDPAYYEE